MSIWNLRARGRYFNKFEIHVLKQIEFSIPIHCLAWARHVRTFTNTTPLELILEALENAHSLHFGASGIKSSGLIFSWFWERWKAERERDIREVTSWQLVRSSRKWMEIWIHSKCWIWKPCPGVWCRMKRHDYVISQNTIHQDRT